MEERNRIMEERDLIALSMFSRAAGEWRCHSDPTALLSSIPAKIMSGEQSLNGDDIRRILMSSHANLISIELALDAVRSPAAGVSLNQLAKLLRVANSTSRHIPRQTADVLLGCRLASQVDKPGNHGRRLRARPQLVEALDRVMLPGIAAILNPRACERPREKLLRAWKEVLLLPLSLNGAPEVDRLAALDPEKPALLDSGLAKRTLATLDATALGITMVLHKHTSTPKSTSEPRTFTREDFVTILDEYGHGTAYRARRIVEAFQDFGLIAELPRASKTLERFEASPRLFELYRATLAPKLLRFREDFGG